MTYKDKKTWFGEMYGGTFNDKPKKIKSKATPAPGTVPLYYITTRINILRRAVTDISAGHLSKTALARLRNSTMSSATFLVEHIGQLSDGQLLQIADDFNAMMTTYKVKTGYYGFWETTKQQVIDEVLNRTTQFAGIKKVLTKSKPSRTKKVKGCKSIW